MIVKIVYHENPKLYWDVYCHQNDIPSAIDNQNSLIKIYANEVVEGLGLPKNQEVNKTKGTNYGTEWAFEYPCL